MDTGNPIELRDQYYALGKHLESLDAQLDNIKRDHAAAVVAATAKRQDIITILEKMGFALTGDLAEQRAAMAMDPVPEINSFRQWYDGKSEVEETNSDGPWVAQAGDRVIFIGKDSHSFSHGSSYKVRWADADWISIERDDQGDPNGWSSRFFKSST